MYDDLTDWCNNCKDRTVLHKMTTKGKFVYKCDANDRIGSLLFVLYSLGPSQSLSPAMLRDATRIMYEQFGCNWLINSSVMPGTRGEK